ncbi:uncharacterized protein LOC100679195 [Nasonia vitripennis]|uniref:Uncharacterized protein n=1 Tax=Nasonia vitripennis TaxID=7425 RepID=A0A7M7J2M7_NASVI|nr:uncharacterized protein LOC100679195 [Nasonia vitripennis]XP_003427296.1 uncharacterized protein LOC100679195 [Nasonia vitripennis]XP_016839912.1 uncharacterized protein LOC100679195 [Nasonia vitripennis]XP_032454404.1 uncharacterized protein LOC100679195 [Nasonia vitripennis]XP_032454405.1 uncharacterized protein LOC100679195 [Nasonia vitripennis]
MATLEELELYFYISCGVTGLCILVIFILIGVLFVKVNRLVSDDSNQLGRQANMMAEFCYTNPTIVPGEELSRRGFSMYSGSDNLIDEYGIRSKYSGPNHETRSKF